MTTHLDDPRTKVEIVLDSISPDNYRITTFQLFMPRYLLAELNTHRMVSKSAASSRAIPVKKRLQLVEQDPYMPIEFCQNKPGMQAGEALVDKDQARAQKIWRKAAQAMARYAGELDQLGVHKQYANRLLEAFVYVPVVFTATEFDNFFKLRNSSEADPGFEILAKKMHRAYGLSIPKQLDFGKWHAPYLTDADDDLDVTSMLKISAARCARVSYLTHDGRKPPAPDDLALANDKLIASGHMSPFDHQALPANEDDYDSLLDLERAMRQFVGWVPFRTQLEDALGMKCRRFYKGVQKDAEALR